MPDLRIVIADDHDLIRRGVRNLISCRKEWQVVGEASNGAEAVEKVTSLRPDVAIVDFSMPILNGPEAASQIAKVSPKTSVVVLTMHDSEHVIRGVLQSGAKGFVLKSDADEDLIAAVEAVVQKRHFFTHRVASMMLEEYFTAIRPSIRNRDEGPRLTMREREVLRLLADGVTSKQIADRLSISVRTVESHRMHINRKLGFGSIADLVRYAIRHGLVTQN
ncbi:MAG TPA: response regulator transcription factor [Acidobacteriaceae bacterium]|jgi:DNA-binding NarL/FixJ family response regulator